MSATSAWPWCPRCGDGVRHTNDFHGAGVLATLPPYADGDVRPASWRGGTSRCGVMRSGAKAWGEVVRRQPGEAVVLDVWDQRAGPGDEPSNVDAVWRSAGVLFHTVGGPPQ